MKKEPTPSTYTTDLSLWLKSVEFNVDICYVWRLYDSICLD